MRALLGSSVRASDASRPVTPLELFFDLVFVYAVSQLTHLLVGSFDVRTAVETLVLALAVVYAWYMTAWLSNWLEPDSHPVHVLLLAVMLASLVMASAIGGAFTHRGWLFVGPYLAIQFGRSAFAVGAFRPGSNQSVHFQNVLVWELASGALWVAGALAGRDDRLLWWAGAVAVAHVGVTTYHWIPGRPSHLAAPIGPDPGDARSDLSGEHLIERLRLFFLIALGETLVTTGATFAGGSVGAGTVAALANAFAASAALWYCYFQRAEAEGLAASEQAGDPSGVAALATHALTLSVVALIAIAVGDELAIAHPGADAGLAYVLLVFGGPVLFLLAQLLFLGRVHGDGTHARTAGIAGLVVLGAAGLLTTTLVASIASTAVLAAVAVADARAGTGLHAGPSVQ
jgi:low temperature requirement protein LtrA